MAGVSVPESGGNRGKKSLDLEIPLVPFIDLLCSLIVFLLMTAVWTQIARLELKQGNAAPPDPNSTPPPIEKKLDLRVEVHEKGFTVVEDNKIETPLVCSAAPCWKFNKVKNEDGKELTEVLSYYDYKLLEETLRQKKAAYPDNNNIVVVLADGVPYNEMIKTMDLCLGVGLDGISVSGTPL